MNTIAVFCTKFIARWQGCWLERSLAIGPPRKDMRQSHGSASLSGHLSLVSSGFNETALTEEQNDDSGTVRWGTPSLGHSCVSSLADTFWRDQALWVTGKYKTMGQKTVWRWQNGKIALKNSPSRKSWQRAGQPQAQAWPRRAHLSDPVWDAPNAQGQPAALGRPQRLLLRSSRCPRFPVAASLLAAPLVLKAPFHQRKHYSSPEPHFGDEKSF